MIKSGVVYCFKVSQARRYFAVRRALYPKQHTLPSVIVLATSLPFEGGGLESIAAAGSTAVVKVMSSTA